MNIVLVIIGTALILFSTTFRVESDYRNDLSKNQMTTIFLMYLVGTIVGANILIYAGACQKEKEIAKKILLKQPLDIEAYYLTNTDGTTTIKYRYGNSP